MYGNTGKTLWQTTSILSLSLGVVTVTGNGAVVSAFGRLGQINNGEIVVLH